jgi:hypothetical protein
MDIKRLDTDAPIPDVDAIARYAIADAVAAMPALH